MTTAGGTVAMATFQAAGRGAGWRRRARGCGGGGLRAQLQPLSFSKAQQATSMRQPRQDKLRANNSLAPSRPCTWRTFALQRHVQLRFRMRLQRTTM